MDPIDRLVQHYAEAGEEERLYMFLTHRDLRPEFTAVDMAPGLNRQAILSGPMAGHKKAGVFQRLTGTCCGWLRHCRSAR